MDKSNIVVVGSSNTDMIIKMDKLPAPGETVLGGEFSIAAGGKGANQAVAAARAGGQVAFVACLGDDMFGRQALEGFAKDSINTEYVFKDKQHLSGCALIFVDKNGENSIAVASGANARLSPGHIDVAKDKIISAEILIMQLETPLETVKYSAQLAFENGTRVVLDPAPAQPLDEDFYKHISILTPNESEAEQLTGIPVKDVKSAEKAAESLLQKGVETVLITLGVQGTFMATEKMRKMIPGFKVTSVDSTAAGDVFNGTLAVSLADKMRLPNAVSFANAAAALSVTKLGAQPSAPFRKEIEEFLKENPQY
jgi:ribokinase